MKILIQWAKSNPEDWEEIDSDDWDKLAKKEKGAVIDNESGIIHAINIQGVEFSHFDHCYIESISDRGCRITVWNDDPDDIMDPVTWEFLPLAPDPTVGGKYNTRQSRIVYTKNEERRQLYSKSQKTIVYDKADFVVPDDNKARNGHKTMDKSIRDTHRSATSLRGWREWTEGLPVDKIRDGKVRD